MDYVNKVDEKLICPACGCNTHQWMKIFYQVRIMSNNRSSIYFAYCKRSNSHVIKDEEITIYEKEPQ